ncbi:hypothetical protein K505DRAFT_215 [Melanomma pulvis-pyrius CBS 109.77]|uniref:Uncharacterized protein n=1 Tax=Melanomma pulvis-pyrius CBS 109.77 TaxID=1314802 RepID=A0A6A6XXL9_9PLEO|nr:hypothetical protein K505DRAFT_215 [Melanomma pulvis-pyrius CBS 109.77]
MPTHLSHLFSTPAQPQPQPQPQPQQQWSLQSNLTRVNKKPPKLRILDLARHYDHTLQPDNRPLLPRTLETKITHPSLSTVGKRQDASSHKRHLAQRTARACLRTLPFARPHPRRRPPPAHTE